MSELTFLLSDVEDDGELLATTCVLAVSVDGARIWPAAGDEECGLEVEIDDLLSHLAEGWKSLILRQTYPGTFNPWRPNLLLSAAANRWGKMARDIAASQDEEVEAFADVHDLSRAFAGLFDLPPLWLVRSGPLMLVDTGETFNRIAIGDAIDGLVAVGDAIAERLKATGDDHWDALISAWQQREDGSGLAIAAWSTSLDHAEVAELAKEGLLALPRTFAEAANDNDVFRIAARMASALPLEEIRIILARVRAIGPTDSPALVQLVEQARALFAGGLTDALPHEQGEELANMVRGARALPENEAVDIFGLIEGLKVPVAVEDVGTPGLDALAVWGNSHGPAVLLNETSERHLAEVAARENPTLRITLGHELCHLLADTDHVLSAVDVLDSRMPEPIEQRARAFAAELLLPTQTAAKAWIDADRPRDRERVEALLADLSHEHVISRAAASWKLQHGARRYGVDLNAVLNVIVPSR